MAGGFLGQAIVRQLIDQGHHVTSFSRTHHSQLDTVGVKQLYGDLTNAGSVKDAVRGMDVVFHVAAKAGVWGNFDDYYQVNVTGTNHVITACQSCRVPMLIYTSSPSVVFNGSDMQGIDESVPYPDHYHAPLPADQSHG